MKITDNKNVSQVSKKKNTSRTNKASGVNFDSLVDAVTGANQVEGADAVDAVAGGASSVDGFDVPKDAEGRGEYMLDTLEELERDILAGNSTTAIEKLKNALETKVVDADQIPPRLQKILDEIEARASIEVAKMEASDTEEY